MLEAYHSDPTDSAPPVTKQPAKQGAKQPTHEFDDGGDPQLSPASFYVRRLKQRLPKHVFEPVWSRLAWLPMHLTVIVLGMLGINAAWMPWPAVAALAIPIGLSFAGLMFLAHETLHGSVVRGRLAWLKQIVGWIGFAPFGVSQQLWVVWHNRVHHGNTQRNGVDPDMYASLDEYHDDIFARISIDHFAVGGRRWLGVITVLIGFTLHGAHMLMIGRSRLGMTAGQHRRAILESLLAITLWAAIAFWLGPILFLFAFVVPHIIANIIAMSFIVTNHGLSQATEINDPLRNSLSVTTPRWIEWATLNFGYHVEHHIFPKMSHRYGPQVRDAILEEWPERYQSMGLFTALRRLHETGRVYKTPTTLFDPKTDGQWPALGDDQSDARENADIPNGRIMHAKTAQGRS